MKFTWNRANKEAKTQKAQNLLEDLRRQRDILERLEAGQLEPALALLGEIRGMEEFSRIRFTPLSLFLLERSYTFRGSSRFVARQYLILGRIFCGLGLYKKAIICLKRGLRKQGSVDSGIIASETFDLRLCLVRANLEKGDFIRAENLLNRLSVPLMKRKEVSLRSRYLRLRASLAFYRGDCGAALENFRARASLYEENKLYRELLPALLDLAAIRLYINQISLARETIEEVLKVAISREEGALIRRAKSQLRDVTRREAALSSNVADSPTLEREASEGALFVVEERPEPDSDLIDESLPEAFRTNYLETFEIYAREFREEISGENLKEAGEKLLRIYRLFGGTDSDFIRLRLEVLENIFLFYNEEYERADKNFRTLARSLKKSGLIPELYQAGIYRLACKRRLNRPARELLRLARKNQGLAKKLVETLKGSERAIFLLDKRGEEEDYLEWEVSEIQRIDTQKVRPLKQFFQKLSVQKRLNRVLGYLEYTAEPGKPERKIYGGRRKHNRPLSLFKRLRQTPAGELRIITLVLPRRLLYICLRRFHLSYTLKEISRDKLRTGLIASGISPERHLRDIKPVSTPSGSGESAEIDYQKMSEEIGLGACLADIPASINKLKIVPDDILHIFPFAVAAYRDGLLIEAFVLSISFSSGFSRLRLNQNDNQKHIEKNALVAGMEAGTEQFSPLPGVREEVYTVAGHLRKDYPELQVLLDTEVQEDPAEMFRRELKRASFVHIASHGKFDLRRPDYSGIVLNNARGESEVFSIAELEEWDLSGLLHITLSACRLADNFVIPGRRLISLPESLLQAGAKTVLGSLWSVDDAFTVSFMSRFYKHLAENSAAEALRLTQLDCLYRRIPGPEELMNQVILWAGFNIYVNTA